MDFFKLSMKMNKATIVKKILNAVYYNFKNSNWDKKLESHLPLVRNGIQISSIVTVIWYVKGRMEELLGKQDTRLFWWKLAC